MRRQVRNINANVRSKNICLGLIRPEVSFYKCLTPFCIGKTVTCDLCFVPARQWDCFSWGCFRWTTHKEITHLPQCTWNSTEGCVHKASFLLSKLSLRTLYYSLVYPYPFYCMAVRGFTYSTNLKRLSIVHKRGLRIINKDAFNADAEPIFAEFKLLKLAQYFYCKKCLVRFTLKIIYSLLSLKITSMLFNKSFIIPGRPISIINIPLPRTSFKRFSILYQGSNV